MNNEDGTPIFAFQELDYIPSGYGGILAPYIETSTATMRAAAVLMQLGLDAEAVDSKEEEAAKTVVCDLGCGDGEFLMALLHHINLTSASISTGHADGVGIDYDAALIKTAGIASSVLVDTNISWLIYNFNDDHLDLATQLLTTYHITHIFCYLVPKQLALLTVRTILTRLCAMGVVVCCHKFFPEYLVEVRRDGLMELRVYDERS